MRFVGYAIVQGKNLIAISQKEQNRLAMFIYPTNKKKKALKDAKYLGGHIECIYLEKEKVKEWGNKFSKTP